MSIDKYYSVSVLGATSWSNNSDRATISLKPYHNESWILYRDHFQAEMNHSIVWIEILYLSHITSKTSQLCVDLCFQNIIIQGTSFFYLKPKHSHCFHLEMSLKYYSYYRRLFCQLNHSLSPQMKHLLSLLFLPRLE